MKRAASLRNDEVTKRLKLTEEQDLAYVYHNTNKCYKGYTHSENLKVIEKGLEVTKNAAASSSLQPDMSAEEESHSMQRRSSSTPRALPSSPLDSKDISCIICGNVRGPRVKGERVANKFRISGKAVAEHFFTATKALNDEVSCRISDFDTAEDIFAADLFYHNVCMKRCNHNYTEYLKPDINTDIRNHKSSIVVKQSRFLQAMENIDPLLQKGYGFTVSDIKDSMLEGDKLDFTIYNRNVKQLLTDHYGDRIQFAPNTRRNESELVFSSHNTASELAVKIKNLSSVKQQRCCVNLQNRLVMILMTVFATRKTLKKRGSRLLCQMNG